MFISKRTPKGKISDKNLVEGHASFVGETTSSGLDRETGKRKDVKFNVGGYYVVLTADEIEFLYKRLTGE